MCSVRFSEKFKEELPGITRKTNGQYRGKIASRLTPGLMFTLWFISPWQQCRCILGMEILALPRRQGTYRQLIVQHKYLTGIQNWLF